MDEGQSMVCLEIGIDFWGVCVFVFSIVFGYPAFLGLCAWLAVGARRGVYFGIDTFWSFFFFGRRDGHWAEHTIEGHGRGNYIVLVGT
jgi:hypothetical protein